MPIIDYAKAADASYESVLNDKKISEQNKEYVKSFDKIYRQQVRPATRNKFYRHLVFFLRETEDVKLLFDDFETVNDLFSRLHNDMSAGYYITIINVTNRFVKWLNDDVKPKGFKDIKSPKKSLQRRKLNKNDMWTWEDGQKLVKATNSSMIKAIVMTQLNLGARPSEFIDLKYGDIEPKGKMMIVHIRDGKTGSREAILFHAVPYLARWLNEHPSKNSNDPLWILEDTKKSHSIDDKGKPIKLSANAIVSMKYPAIRKRIEKLKAKTGITKSSDFYTLRHSCARLLRMWNVPIEECAKQLGHSIKEFTETYGRLDTRDREARHAKAFGLDEVISDELPEKPLSCPKCEQINAPKQEYCTRCGSPLTLKKAIDEDTEMADRIAQLVMKKMKNQDEQEKPKE